VTTSPGEVFRAAAAPPADSQKSVQAQPAHRAGATIAPSTGRAQTYEADIRLRVANLSNATKRALRLTRSFGGYVRSVDYGSGARAGTADLVVRIPIGSVQAAIVRFTALGAIVEQHVAIQDVQNSFDARFRRLQALRTQIAAVQKQLAGPNLTTEVRHQLEARLTALRASLAALQRVQAQAEKRVSFATVALSLTSHKAAAVPPPKPGRLQRALDHAGSILLRELVVLVYVAVVGVPLLVLVALAVSGERLRRRRSTDRLLATR
jgi:hypothetical protein